MPVIQSVKGRNEEYAVLGVDLHYGCVHGCLDCPVPERMKWKPVRFFGAARMRPGVLGGLKREIYNLRQLDGPILLCPNTDPYQRESASNWVVRTAIEILNRRGLGAVIRTKAGKPAEKDLDLLKGHPDNLLVVPLPPDETIRQEREPKAAPVQERLSLIQLAKFLGVKTVIEKDSGALPLKPQQGVLPLVTPQSSPPTAGMIDLFS